MKQPELSVFLWVTGFNLMLGNAFFSAGSGSWKLALGMSIGCIIIYYLLYLKTGILRENAVHIFMASILAPMWVMILGNGFITMVMLHTNDLAINTNSSITPGSTAQLLIGQFLFGMAGNLIFLPFNLFFGVVNFIITMVIVGSHNRKFSNLQG